MTVTRPADRAAELDRFRADVLLGLRAPRKTLPCKYFYDVRGSQLFDCICDLEEYYPTRTESAIMREHGVEMAGCLGPGCLLVEFGSGSSRKTRILLDYLREPAGYVPIDISGEHLLMSAAELRMQYPRIPVLPVCADYTGRIDLPEIQGGARRTAVFFPGSTIGNFEPTDAVRFLARIADLCGGGGLLIGVDLKKDRAVLERAYNDARGITAEFNLNLLRRINRELGGGFQLHRFDHHAVFNADEGRIEMHLVSLDEQTVKVGDAAIRFREGETICTEYSYKYDPAEFAGLAGRAGYRVERVWTDPRGWFSVQYLSARPAEDATGG